MPGREGEDVSEHGREISHSLSTDSFETGMNRDGVPPIADTKVRVILMSNHIILDPEIFGPVVSWKSEILRASQLHAVYMKSKAHEKCLVLEVQGERLHGLELVTNMRMYQFSFQSTAAVQYIFNRLQEMCKKAHEKRKRPIWSNCLSELQGSNHEEGMDISGRIRGINGWHSRGRRNTSKIAG